MTGWFDRLSEPRKTAMTQILAESADYDMTATLPRVIAAVEAGDCNQAGLELLNSPWARQAGQPAKALVDAFLAG